MYRMKDALASTIVEETYGLHVVEWGFIPHDFYFKTMRLMQSLSHPEDVRSMYMSTMNRRNRYMNVHVPGEKQNHMTLPMSYLRKSYHILLQLTFEGVACTFLVRSIVS